MIAGGYYEDDEGPGTADGDQDIEMAAPQTSDSVPPVPDLQTPGLNEAELISMDPTEDTTPPVEVKAEEKELAIPSIEEEPIEIDEEPPQSPPAPPEDTFLISDSEAEEKPKPIMKLHYQGFSIRGRALCVIVEPYPPLRKPPRAMSLAPTGIVGPRAPSIAPPDFVVRGQRARTPLFLPDDDRERSVTPAPWQQERERPPVPLFHEDAPGADEDDTEGGMLVFSQILKSVGDYATGAAEDDDEIEGAVFLGDADEARGM